MQNFLQSRRIVFQDLIQLFQQMIGDVSAFNADGVHFGFSGRAVRHLLAFLAQIGGHAVLQHVLQMPTQLDGAVAVVIVGSLPDFVGQAGRQLIAVTRPLQMIFGFGQIQTAFNQLLD